MHCSEVDETATGSAKFFVGALQLASRGRAKSQARERPKCSEVQAGRAVSVSGYAPEMRQAYQTGGFEDIAGYSRGVRIDRLIAISATAATDESGKARFPGDVYAQTKAAFEQALEAVDALGGDLASVLRTRIYLVLDCEWRRAVDAHLELFGEVRPANATFYVAGFIPEGVLVEVELDAVVSA